MNHNSGATKGMPCYSASITREQFLFKENRIVAALILEGKTFDEILEQCTDENLFQLPTQKSIRSIALACYKRLTFPDSKELIELIAKGDANDARLALLYAFTCQNLIVRDFMVDVIGPKYKSGDYSFDKNIDLSSLSEGEVFEYIKNYFHKKLMRFFKTGIKSYYTSDKRLILNHKEVRE